ncbi:MAG: hypothetical protein JXB18_09385 [Sedimentisphaerales bacterium]|nr:hypothetical protein [Sedimentisphaerales bacterium]
MNKRNLFIVCGVCLMLAGITASAKTVAYWRFEEGPAGVNVQHGEAAGVFSPDLLDSSGNGNALSVWDSGQWQFRANVPYANIPWTGESNVLSVKNVSGSPTLWNTSLATWEPAQWTIEATFKAEAGGWKTIVGRDSQGAAINGGNTDPGLSALYFQTTDNPTMGLAIKYVDKAGYWHDAVSAANAYTGFTFSSDPDGNNAPWYTMAATSDGRYLRLYLYNHNTPENGYVMIAETDMTVTNPGSTDTAFSLGAGDGGDWDVGNITVGRGMYGGGHGDRFYGYLDEVRLSDKALSPSEFLLAPGYVQPVSPAKDEYLATTAATTYTWTTNIDLMTENEVMFDHYAIYIADNAEDLTAEQPSTSLHSNVINQVATQSYSGYNGTYAYGEDYYWRIDMVTMDPNDTDPNNVVYNIPNLYQGIPVRFFGPRACPAVSISGNVSILPDPITQIYTAQDAVFTAGITRGSVAVDAISWYKVNGVQDADIFDPNDLPDSLITHVPGVTEIAYIPDLTTATSTTLTVVDAAVTDNGDYYAKVRLVDPLGGSTGCDGVSPTTNLFVRDDTSASTNYLVHRYGFDGNANDSIGTAHGTVVDLGDVNHTFESGQLALNNAGLNSRPIQNDPNIGDRLLDAQGAYVDLPNGLISPLGKSATFMAWFTFTPIANDGWPRIFDFGTSTGGEGFATGADGVRYVNGLPYVDTASADAQEYVMLTPQQGTGSAWRFESLVRPPSNSVNVDPSNNAELKNVEACVACVFDAATGFNTVYLNGVQVLRAANTTHTLANINDVNNWLGRSQWPDAMFSGKLNEFRIYDIPLSKYWVKAYFEQGADDYTSTPNPCIQDEANAMDFNTDCVVDMLDFAAFAEQWLSCDRLYGCN